MSNSTHDDRVTDREISRQRKGKSETRIRPRSVMALEERERVRRGERRMKALYRSAVLNPGEFSHANITREDLIEASRDLQRLAARGSSRRREE